MGGNTLAGLRHHARRLWMPVVAIALGVAFVTGTLVLSDSMTAAMTRALGGEVTADVVVRGSPLDNRTLARVRAVPGVATAEGRLATDLAGLLGRDGRPLVSRRGGDRRQVRAVGLPTQERLRDFRLASGRLPTGPDQALLDERTATDTGFGIGDRIQVQVGDSGSRQFQLTGLASTGAVRDGFETLLVVRADTLTGLARLGAGTDPERRAQLAAGPYESIEVLTGPGVAAEQVSEAVSTALGGRDQQLVRTGRQLAEERLGQFRGELRAITLGLFGFAVITLLVSAAVIQNTFTILVAQRTRELALLRCVGATRGQVFGTVLAESALVGAVAAGLGVLGGYGLTLGLWVLVGQFGLELPAVSLTLSPLAALTGFGLGLLVTVAAALLPARQATRVAPVAALRTQRVDTAAGGRRGRRVAVGLSLAVTGAAGLTVGVLVKGALGVYSVIAGGSLVFLAVAVLGPVLVGPLTRLVGWPVERLLGPVGRLAVANSRRNPRRVAATTLALTIGIGLVTMGTVLADTGKATADRELSRYYPADFTVSSSRFDSTDRQLPAGTAQRVRALPGFGPVVEVRSGQVTLDGSTEVFARPRRSGPGGGPAAAQGPPTEAVSAFSAGALGPGGPLPLALTAGSLAGFRPGTALVDAEVADRVGGLGRPLLLGTEAGRQLRLTVAGVLGARSSAVQSRILVTEADFGRGFGARTRPEQLLLNLRPGVGPAAGRASLEQALVSSNSVRLDGQVIDRERTEREIDRLLLIVVAMVSLALLVALVGIANTLSLSVFERTRESGLLRALGLTPSQLRAMLATESVVMALVGAVTGIGLGLLGAWSGFHAIARGDQLAFTVPYGQIALSVLGAAVAGVVAAVLPARRAARVPVVTALGD